MTRSLLKIVLLVLVCSLVGGGVVYRYRDQIRGVTRNARLSGLLPLPARSSGRSVRATPAPERDEDKTEPAAAQAEKTPAAETPAATSKASDSAEKKKRVQLERELKRLRDQLNATQRENAEMKLQLKLLKEGSRTK